MADDAPARDPTDDRSLTRSPQQEREFAAALRLRDWVKDLLDGPARAEWRMEPGAFDNIFVITFAKGTRTFRAVVLLCDRGYGQQAEMLNRSLFEHAVIAWWLLLCHADDSETVMEALRDHHDHARVLFDRAIERHPELDEERGPSPFTAERTAELDARFGEHGRQWHRKRLDQLVREVEARIDDRYKDLFWQFFRFVNHHNNYVLHHSTVGITDMVRWDDADETPVVSVGPSQDWRSSALWAACWSYGLLVVATLRRLSPDRANEFADLLVDLGRELRTLHARDVRGVGRNDPCPCGSGKKLKNCHGPVVVPD